MALLARRVRSIGRPLTVEEKKTVTDQAAKLRARLAEVLSDRMIGGRPELVSKGKPVGGELTKRGLDEARTRLERKREFREACSECPAATVFRQVGDAVSVLCNVEGSLLSSRTDPQSVLTFCMGDYLSCPTWIAGKEAEWAGRDVA